MIIGKVTANVVLELLMFYNLLVIILIEEGQLNILIMVKEIISKT